MRYCNHCGKEINDDAVICINCGCSTQNNELKKSNSLQIAAQVFMIISTIYWGFFLIPLAWCIPMTVALSNKIKSGEQISTGFKVCILLFVNIISGILLLCDTNNK